MKKLFVFCFLALCLVGVTIVLVSQSKKEAFTISSNEGICGLLQKKYSQPYSISCDGENGKVKFNVSPSFKPAETCVESIAEMEVSYEPASFSGAEKIKMSMLDVFLNTFSHKQIGQDELNGSWENLKGQSEFLQMIEGAQFSGTFKVKETAKVWDMKMVIKENSSNHLVIHTNESTNDNNRTVVHKFEKSTGKVTSEIQSKQNGSVKCASSEG